MRNGVSVCMRVKRPLIEALQKHISKQPISLHVPGHKNGLLTDLPEGIRRALAYDVTELTDLDDLHCPEEVIFQAQQLLSNLYESKKSYFLINGSTVGNLAMIYGTCEKGDKILVQRNAHKSIFHAIELVGVEPVYLMPEWNEQTQTMGTLSLETIQKAIEEHSDAKAIVLTTPTYYGNVAADLQKQIEACHQMDILVLVDEAHGAHLVASDRFPNSALDFNADIVVQSAHKTLPAMTMASFLHIKGNRVDIEKVERYLQILQSSSPSYLLLASLDEARAYVESYKMSDATYLLEKRVQWIAALNAIPNVQLIESDDPLKLCMRVKRFSGAQLQAALEQQGIFVELADKYQVLFVLPLLKVGQSFPFAQLRIKIRDAVMSLKNETPTYPEEIRLLQFEKISRPVLTNEEVNKGDKEWIPYMRSIGRIAAGMVIPYPPGVPLLVPGEKITVQILSQLEDFLAIDASFQGQHRLQEKMIYVMK